MRKRFLLISTIIVLSAFTFAACGKKSPSSPESTNSETTTAEPTTEENTEKDTTEEEKPVATATSEESTKEQTKTTTATKKDEQAKPKSATGTYNGFADTSSVEIEMSDGSYQTIRKRCVRKCTIWEKDSCNPAGGDFIYYELGDEQHADDGAGSGRKELCERCCVCVF